jgi:putative transposase
VVLNPVRAGMMRDLQEWPWSSYGSMTGKSPSPDWLETDWVLACFGKQRKRVRAKYIDFVRAGIGLPPIWEDLKYQMYLGSDDFVESMRHKLDGSKKEDLREISRLQHRPMAKPLQWYEDNTAERKQAMALAYASGDYTMKEISEWFCVHYSTVSRAVKLFEVNA